MDIKTMLLIFYLALWGVMEIHQYFLRKDLRYMDQDNYDLHSDTREMIKDLDTNVTNQLAAMSKEIDCLNRQNHDLKKDNAELMRQNAALMDQLDIIVEKLRDIETGNTKVMTI